MSSSQQRTTVVLALVALLGVGGLFAASFAFDDAFANLLIGIASSVAAVAIYTLAELTTRILSRRRLVRFFGRELVRNQAIFVLPNFEVNKDALKDGVAASAALSRPTKDLREPLIPMPTRPLGMGNLTTFAAGDIEATLQVASVFAETGSPSHRVISDQDVLRRWTEPGAPFYSESFISIGFSSNDITLAYAYDPNRSLISLESFQPEGGAQPQLAFRVDGQELYSNSITQVFGIVVRYTSEENPDRRCFLCGGLSSAGTAAAARYLANHWHELAKNVDDRDFLAVIRQPAEASTRPRLLRIHQH